MKALLMDLPRSVLRYAAASSLTGYFIKNTVSASQTPEFIWNTVKSIFSPNPPVTFSNEDVLPN